MKSGWIGRGPRPLAWFIVLYSWVRHLTSQCLSPRVFKQGPADLKPELRGKGGGAVFRWNPAID